MEILGSRGHEWRIATGKVCYPLLEKNVRRGEKLENVRQEELDKEDKESLEMVFFGHKLDLKTGYEGAALVNLKGNIVGMQTSVPGATPVGN